MVTREVLPDTIGLLKTSASVCATIYGNNITVRATADDLVEI